MFLILPIFSLWSRCCKSSNIKIYSMIKSFIGDYYASDKLFCLNSSLQTNLFIIWFLNYCRLLFQFVNYGQIKYYHCHCYCHSLIHSLIHPLTYSLTYSLALIHSPTASFTISLTHCLTHSPMCSLSHSSTHSPIYSLINSLISLTHSLNDIIVGKF